MEQGLFVPPLLPSWDKDVTPGDGVVILEPWKDKFEIQSQPTKDHGVERDQDPDGIVKQLSQLQQLPTSRILVM